MPRVLLEKRYPTSLTRDRAFAPLHRPVGIVGPVLGRPYLLATLGAAILLLHHFGGKFGPADRALPLEHRTPPLDDTGWPKEAR